MEPVGLSAGDLSSILAGLGTQSNNKKKTCVESVYSCGFLYKKSKNPGTSSGVMNLLAGLIPDDILHTSNLKHKMSWDSKVKNKNASINKVSNIENMNNIMAEEISYVNSNNSETNNMVNDMTLRKTWTRTYVLEHLPKKPSFNNTSNINDILKLLSLKFKDFN
ncbi:hypothetical protein G9A89_020926 [Geosiphon pyriformis]|nr:hypothetical protein G9A89_020926 [Geosiphon pyriformis]